MGWVGGMHGTLASGYAKCYCFGHTVLLGKDWAHKPVFWHPGQATTWHPGVCQVATGNSTWLCPVVVHQPMKQLARPPMPSCHQGTTHTGCAGLPSLFGPHLGWATMPGCHQGTTQIGCAGLPSLFFATGCLSRPLRVPLHSLD